MRTHVARWCLPWLLFLLISGCHGQQQGEFVSYFSSIFERMAQQLTPIKQRFSAVSVLNTITPKNFSVLHDLAYGTDDRQQLDLYLPLRDELAVVPKPIILFIHGGSWQMGSKDEYLFVGESFSQAGYVTAIMNYRLAPQHKYPDYVQDAALALRWLSDHAAQYGADPQQLIVVGHSAGAFNALEVVDNQRWLAEVGLPVQQIKAVVGVAGPYSFDFNQFDDTRSAFDSNSSPDEVMPDRHVRADAPPHLLLVASNDQTVQADNAIKMAKALRDQHVPVQMHFIEGASHISIMASVATRLSWYKPTRHMILSYLQGIVSTDKAEK